MNQRQVGAGVMHIFEILEQFAVVQFHPIGNDNLSGANLRFAGGVFHQLNHFAGAVGTAADLQRHPALAAHLHLNVHHAAKLVESERVELAGAAGSVDAVNAVLAHALDVGPVTRLVEAFRLVPTQGHAGPDAATGFTGQTTHG